MKDLCKEKINGKVLECGCFPGKWLAWFNKELNMQPYGIDTLPSEQTISFLKNHNIKAQIKQADVRKIPFKDNYFDFVYIDGDHSYEFVKKDLEGFLPKIKKGGYLTVDDYAFWKIVLGYGVKKAVDEFVRNHKKIDLRVDGGQAILRVK